MAKYEGIGRASESLEEDDDDEDLGGQPLNSTTHSTTNNGKKGSHGLNFDSDEDKEDNELITLDKD